MKHRHLTLISIFIFMTLILAACGSPAKQQREELLHLTFDEGSGLTVKDAAGKLPDTELNYLFAHAAYMDSRDPEWREDGIVSQSNKAKKQGILLGYERFGRLTFQVGTGNEWLSIWADNGNLEKYAWNLVTATFDGEAGEMKLFLNGNLVASGEVPQGSEIVGADKNGLLIGRNGEGERLAAGYLNVASGLIDDVVLYGEALSEQEIADYFAGITVPEINFEEIWLQNILTGDYTRTQFHGGPYQFWMNEPHAPVYYNGMYHLFFQENMTGSYWRNICWGHLVSTDMVNWKPVKEAIVPTENTVVPDGVWSGGATLDKNGTPLLFFTAGNDSFREVAGLISNQNIGVAYPADLKDPELIDWVVCDELALIQQPGQGRAGEFRDPHIWKEGDSWYMLVCSGSAETAGGSALLYVTDTLELKDDGTVAMDWQYKGPVYEMENQSALYGTSWELPIILPVTNEAGTITKYFFEISPAPASIADNKVYYWLGDFDPETGKFTPDEAFSGEPHLLDYGANVFTGPSCLVDPVSGNTYMFSIMQDQRGASEQGSSGWAHTVGLARRIWLNDEGTDLCIEPIEALHELENEVLLDASGLTLDDANAKLAEVNEDMYYLRMDVDVSGATEFGIKMLQGGKWDETSFSYDAANGMIEGFTENKGEGAKVKAVSGSLENNDDILSFEIYVDRSLLEAFFEDQKAISIRAYPEEKDSRGISLFGEGDVTIENLYVASMGSIFD